MSEAYDWPVLRRYDVDHQLRVAMPIGGIGTGSVSLGGRGDLRDWELENSPRKGFAPRHSFFAIRAEDPVGGVTARVLQGPIDPTEYEGAHGSVALQHGLPRFRHSEFLAAYPLGQVELSDRDVPVSVRLQAFNPLIPTDADASGIPVAVFRYLVTNQSDRPLQISVVGNVGNLHDAPFAAREATRVGGVASEDGTLAFAVLDERDVSVRTGWKRSHWSEDILDFWDDFTFDGHVDDRDNETAPSVCSVAANHTLEPGDTHAFTFLLGWRYPHRLGWSGDSVVGNYYAETYASAWEVIERTSDALVDLESRTVEFVQAFCASDLPEVVKEAALFNVSTLRTQSCFRTPDGRLWGWEGCNPGSGCCHGTCVHVWNYEQATPFLFGELARSMRDTELRYGTDDHGHQSFRIQLPLESADGDHVAAADGQMGSLMKLYREWRMSGDDAMLHDLWPKARKALEFAWVPGGWDADRDGVMEGSQHNTMDVEYFGPNPEVGVWYLGALRACEEMARYLGDDAFAEECADLFTRGSAWLDAELFNGEYYRHQIRTVDDESAIAPGLRLPGIGARDLSDPEFQIGDGCLADQLVGQVHAHAGGLGYLLDRANVTTTLRSVLRHNRVAGFSGHLNPVRSYALGDEAGLTVASYPRGGRPRQPFPYYAEVWSGLEYTVAVGMFHEGMVEEGVDVITDVRDRFDGRKRNPFNEAECGFHYVRAMASWGAIPALTGFRYDGVDGILELKAADRPTTWFWSSGDAYGTIAQRPRTDRIDVVLRVLGGSIGLRAVVLAGVGVHAIVDPDHAYTAGASLEFTIPQTGPMTP